MQKLLFTTVILVALIGCSGEAPSASGSSSSTSSSGKASSSSSSSSSTSSSSTSSSSTSSSSSGGAAAGLLIQEAQPGFCSYTGEIGSTHSGYTGTGYVDGLNQTGVAVEWAVNVALSGTYQISLRYANATEARPAVLKTAFNEITYFNFDSTSAWTQWQTETRSIYLEAGNNLLNLDAQSASGLANIDAVTIFAADNSGAKLTAGQCSTAPVNNLIFPNHNTVNVNPDTRLRINFDAKPSIKTGDVQIYDTTTNNLVDTIKVTRDTDVLGFSGQSATRTLNVVPAQIIGNSIFVSPHTNRLQYGKKYSVVIANGVFTGMQGGRAFAGFSAGQWQFTTKSSGPSGPTVSVDDDGQADFGSVQGALNYVMKNIAANAAAVVNVRNGVYPEALYLRDKNNIRINGESRDGTVVRFDNYEGLNSGTNGRALFLIQAADLVSVENMTIFNTHQRASASTGNQAEALYFGSDTGRFVAKNAAFISEQDTLQLRGYSWFYNSVIAGNVDFIWGSARVGLFENSEIRSLGDSQGGGTSTSGGYIVQARITSNAYPGFVFLNSKLTRAAGPLGNTIANAKTYLARSGYSSGSNNFDSFAFINCAMDAHIAPVGWFTETDKTRNPLKGTATFGFREFGSVDLAGNKLNLSARDGAYLLTQSEYTQSYANRALIFASFNNGQGWNPQP
ncbi:MAG TPA: pectinesterase family protein [Cellvibrionaceae bacterium]